MTSISNLEPPEKIRIHVPLAVALNSKGQPDREEQFVWFRKDKGMKGERIRKLFNGRDELEVVESPDAEGWTKVKIGKEEGFIMSRLTDKKTGKVYPTFEKTDPELAAPPQPRTATPSVLRVASKEGTPVAVPAVKTGAQVLVDTNFAALEALAKELGRPVRIGLIANQTTMIRNPQTGAMEHLADFMAKNPNPNVRLVALYGPEHGIRGTAAAGAEVKGGVDVSTGLPVHSLYGKTKKPTPEMLKDVDAMVFDVQDVGLRYYTYVATMALAMQAALEKKDSAFAKGMPFMVLGRANPMGGDYVAGHVAEPGNQSFVSQLAIPTAHGMTVDELAKMFVKEPMLFQKGSDTPQSLKGLNLSVVPMEGWKRNMHWRDTGLSWIPTSPNLPGDEERQAYAATASFLENTDVNTGRGLKRGQFTVAGAPWIKSEKEAQALANKLNAVGLKGVEFERVAYTPREIDGMAPDPIHQDKLVRGVKLKVTDAKAFDPLRTNAHILKAFFDARPKDMPVNTPDEKGYGFFKLNEGDWTRLMAGKTTVKDKLVKGESADAIAGSWKTEVEQFKKIRERYLNPDYAAAAEDPAATRKKALTPAPGGG
ncbi:MAG: DUF1343 domain-containing protein [Proteobacteria bacterium]|nr:DUF1343 domain-containing protein [Pseudomonadota bacterium]